MNHLPKHISKITEEKLDATSKISKETITQTHKDLLRDFDISEIKKNTNDIENTFPDIVKVRTTDLPLMTKHPKYREYTPDLDDALREVDSLYEQDETKHIFTLIDTIIKYHKKTLVQADYINLLLKKARMLNNSQNITASMKTLQQLAAYEKDFTQDDKNLYYLITGSNLYDQAIEISKVNPGKAITYFIKARESFATLLNQKTLLETNRYKHLMFRSALCYYKLSDFNQCDDILSEIHAIPDETDNTTLISQIFYLHGLVYQNLKQYQKAIDSFREYLSYEPDDHDTKKRIRLLSEELPE